jgi:hypothetical protein
MQVLVLQGLFYCVVHLGSRVGWVFSLGVKFLVVRFRVVIFYSLGSLLGTRRPWLSLRRRIPLQQPSGCLFIWSLHQLLVYRPDLFSRRTIILSVLVSQNFSSRIKLCRLHVLELSGFINTILSLFVLICSQVILVILVTRNILHYRLSHYRRISLLELSFASNLRLSAFDQLL